MHLNCTVHWAQSTPSQASALSTQCTTNFEHSHALSTQCRLTWQALALSVTDLLGIKVQVRASCVVLVVSTWLITYDPRNCPGLSTRGMVQLCLPTQNLKRSTMSWGTPTLPIKKRGFYDFARNSNMWCRNSSMYHQNSNKLIFVPVKSAHSSRKVPSTADWTHPQCGPHPLWY